MADKGTTLGDRDAGPSVACDSQRWKPRVRLAWLVRAVTVVLPLGLAVAAGLSVGSLVRTSSGGWTTRVVAWLVASAVATAVLLVTDRIFRRLMPLAVLLRLSLVFPDRAPSRFSTALRSCAKLRPERELALLAGEEVDEDPGRAAERIVTLLGSLNAHDRQTRGHSERVRAIADLIGAEMDLGEIDADRLRWAALLHDIGKLRTSVRILRKPADLTAPEWEHIRRHPAAGARIAAPLEPWLGDWWHGIGQHHEHWDGSGYPSGLAGTEISLAARIVAVADSFEVMTAPRPYHRAVSLESARRELVHVSGSQFDPSVVRAFLSVSIGRLYRVMGPLSWLGQLPLLRAAPQIHSVLSLAGTQAATGTAVVGAGVVTLAALSAAPSAPARPIGAGPAASAGSSARGADHGAGPVRVTPEVRVPDSVLAGNGLAVSHRPSRGHVDPPSVATPQAGPSSATTATGRAADGAVEATAARTPTDPVYTPAQPQTAHGTTQTGQGSASGPATTPATHESAPSAEAPATETAPVEETRATGVTTYSASAPVQSESATSTTTTTTTQATTASVSGTQSSADQSAQTYHWGNQNRRYRRGGKHRGRGDGHWGVSQSASQPSTDQESAGWEAGLFGTNHPAGAQGSGHPDRGHH